jgi:hypothetical protein
MNAEGQELGKERLWGAINGGTELLNVSSSVLRKGIVKETYLGSRDGR